MLIQGGITRRSFLKGLFSAAAGAGLNSFIPMPLKPPLPSREIRPYWLDVLSQGVRYFPGNIVAQFSDWSCDRLRVSAHGPLVAAIGENRRVLDRGSLPGSGRMDELVERNKSAQYLYESLRLARSDEGDDSPFHTDDLYYARMLYDLSSLILCHVVGKIEQESFSGFSPFDITLLRSCLTYARKATDTNEDSYVLCPGDLREAVGMNIGSCYNNQGLTLSYLGDVRQAQEAFQKALEHRPGSSAILGNLRDMDSNGHIVNQRLYSRTLAD